MPLNDEFDKYDEAIANFTEIIRIDSTDKKARIERANTYRSAGATVCLLTDRQGARPSHICNASIRIFPGKQITVTEAVVTVQGCRPDSMSQPGVRCAD